MKGKTMTPSIIAMAFIAIIAIAGIIAELTTNSDVEKTPIEATIVGAYQDQVGNWWTTLAWGDGDRGTWNNKFGAEGDKVKIYPIANGKFSTSP